MADTHPFFDEVMEFRRALTPETDRGCALMAAAYLDEQLGRLLRAAFVEDVKVLDALLESIGPLATFSSRIDLCYALGLLPPLVRRDVHLIRKIRNEFAHAASPLTFEHARMAARCSELHYAFCVVGDRTRAKFTNAALGVCAVIHGELVAAKHPGIPRDMQPSDEERQEMKRIVHELANEIERKSKQAEQSSTSEHHA